MSNMSSPLQAMTMKRRDDRDQEVRVLQGEVLSWMDSLLGLSEKLGRKPLLQDLLSGIYLCELLRELKKRAPAMPMGRVRIRNNAGPASLFLSNENVQTFQDECLKIGVPKTLKIEPVELTRVTGRYAPRNFLLQVLALSRIMFQEHGIEPPEMVRMEIEVEEARKAATGRKALDEAELARLQAQERERRDRLLAEAKQTRQRAVSDAIYQQQLAAQQAAQDQHDSVDTAIQTMNNTLGLHSPPVRVSRGEYYFAQLHKGGPMRTHYVRMIHGSPLVRVEEEKRWEDLTVFMGKLKAIEMQNPELAERESHFKASDGSKGDDAESLTVVDGSAETQESKLVGQHWNHTGGVRSMMGEVDTVTGGRSRIMSMDDPEHPHVVHTVPLPQLLGVALPGLTRVEEHEVAPSPTPILIKHARKVTRHELQRKDLMAAEHRTLLQLIRSIEKPLDKSCLELGDRWYRHSGAQVKQEQEQKRQLTYAAYLAAARKGGSDRGGGDTATARRWDEDMKQISLDVTQGRTQGSLYSHESSRKFFCALEEQNPMIKESLCNVLQAYCVRNPDVGYAQGMNDVVFLLLGFVTEEQAFWLLNTAVDNLRSPSFYRRDPPMMFGLQTATHVLGRLAVSSFPDLVEHAGGEEEVRILVQLCTLKWWINVFVDTLEFEALLCLSDHFYREPPDTGVEKALSSSGQELPEPVAAGDLVPGDEYLEPPGTRDRSGSADPDADGHLTVVDESLHGGDTALMRASLAIIEWAEPKLLAEDSELFPTLLKAAAEVPSEVILAGMADRWCTATELLALQADAIKHIETDWSRLRAQFRLLAESVRISGNQLECLKRNFPKYIGPCDRSAREAPPINDSSLRDLLSHCHVQLSDTALQWLFTIFDPENSGSVDARDVISCLAALCDDEGIEQRVRQAFGVFEIWENTNSGGRGDTAVSTATANELATSLLKMVNRGARQLVRSQSKHHLMEVDGDNKLHPYTESLPQVVYDGRTDAQQRVPFAHFYSWFCRQPVLVQCFLVSDTAGTLKPITHDHKMLSQGDRGVCSGVGRACGSWFPGWFGPAGRYDCNSIAISASKPDKETRMQLIVNPDGKTSSTTTFSNVQPSATGQ